MNHKLLQIIEQFQKQGFFYTFGNNIEELTETITNQSVNSYFGDLRNLENEPLFEQIILSFDNNICWFVEDANGYYLSDVVKPELYFEVFNQLSRISKGIFIPQNLQIKECGFCEGRDKRIAIDYIFDDKEIDLVFCADGWALMLNFLEEINETIQSSSHSFEYIIDVYGACFVFFINQNQKKFLTEQKNWNFISNTTYWTDKALYYKEKNNPEKAEECFKRTIINSNNINSIVQYAIFLKENSRNSEAISIFEFGKAFLDNPDLKLENRQWWLEFINNQIPNF